LITLQSLTAAAKTRPARLLTKQETNELAKPTNQAKLVILTKPAKLTDYLTRASLSTKV
jgi:hypothetical protein